MDLNPMNGVVNADFVKANITTKKNASIPVDTATSVAAIRALSVVEEDLKEKTGTTILDRTKDTETKIKNQEIKEPWQILQENKRERKNTR